MRKRFYHPQWVLLIGVLAVAIGAFTASAGEYDDIPAKNMPTLLVLGTQSCPACSRMKPILEKIGRQYAEKVAVLPIDVGIHKQQMERFKVKAIPVEIFFTADGREIYRHLGFMDEGAILDQFKTMGVGVIKPD